MIFIKLSRSDRAEKKYVIEYKEPNKKIHFGSKNSSTYLDNADKTKRSNYIKRHSINENWDEVNAGSLSRFLLWGDTTDINKNLTEYLRRFDIKKSK